MMKTIPKKPFTHLLPKSPVLCFRAKRIPQDVKRYCNLCKNHLPSSPPLMRGHVCSYKDCPCSKCSKVRDRRFLMSQQIRIRRSQDKELRANGALPQLPVLSVSPNPVKDCSGRGDDEESMDIKASSHEGLITAERKKNTFVYYCQRCKNHGLLVFKKNHKPRCTYAACTCELCTLIDGRKLFDSHKEHGGSDTSRRSTSSIIIDAPIGQSELHRERELREKKKKISLGSEAANSCHSPATSIASYSSVSASPRSESGKSTTGGVVVKAEEFLPGGMEQSLAIKTAAAEESPYHSSAFQQPSLTPALSTLTQPQLQLQFLLQAYGGNVDSIGQQGLLGLQTRQSEQSPATANSSLLEYPLAEPLNLSLRGCANSPGQVPNVALGSTTLLSALVDPQLASGILHNQAQRLSAIGSMAGNLSYRNLETQTAQLLQLISQLYSTANNSTTIQHSFQYPAAFSASTAAAAGTFQWQ